MKIFLKLLRESYFFAIHEIVVNKVRTLLSLLGITIGIFSIISVFTIFDSMEININNQINSLGNDVLFVQKWPWAMGGDYPWWKYFNRPEASLADLKEIQKRSQTSQACAYMANVSETIKYRDKSIENSIVVLVSEGYDGVMPLEISEGRFISPAEFVSGKPVAIIGYEIVENLFENQENNRMRFVIEPYVWLMLGILFDGIRKYCVRGRKIQAQNCVKPMMPSR